MSLRSVRTELAQVVASASGLTCLDHVPVTPQTPSAYVGFPTIPSFGDGATADGAVTALVPVTFVVGLGDPVAAQHSLDAVPGSVPHAIRSHEATSWKSARPTSTTEPQVTGDDRLTFDLVVSIHAAL